MAPRRQWNTCLLLVSCYFLYGYFFAPLPSSTSTTTIGVGRKTSPNVFSSYIKDEEHYVKKDLDESLKEFCSIQGRILSCQLDKLCASSVPLKCANRLGEITAEYNPLGLRLTIGDTLPLFVAGSIVDAFLAPHSLWTVTEEPYSPRGDSGGSSSDGALKNEFVLTRIPSSSLLHKIYHTLDQRQFPLECKKFWIKKISAKGFVPSLSQLSYGLTIALETTFTYIGVFDKTTGIFPYFNCPQNDWSCHFLPITNCTVLPSPLASEYKSDKDDMVIIDPTVVPEPFNSLLQSSGIPNPMLWWRMHLTRYLLRPHYVIRQKVAELESDLQTLFELQRKQKQHPTFDLHYPCLTMYIDDASLSSSSSQWVEGEGKIRNYNFTQYVRAARPLLKLLGTKDIFLVVDPGVPSLDSEISKFLEINFSYFPKESLHGTIPALLEEEEEKKVKEDPMAKMYWLLTLLRTVGSCGAFVGTFESSFSRLIYESMCFQNNGVCPLSASLDDSEWHV